MKLKIFKPRIICALLCALSLILPISGVKTAFGEVENQINLADYKSFRWAEGVNPLRDGTVYRYRYVYGGSWHDYYTTSPFETPPRPEWQNWELYSAVDAPCSIVEYSASGMHSVSVLIPELSTSAYTVEYEGNFAQDAGVYVATAVIKPVNSSVKFIYDTDGVVNIVGRGMSAVIDADGTATVTKIWYVARFENELLDESASIENGEETAYTMQNWTFGSFPEGGIALPRLMHGDEVKGVTYQPEGYWLKVEGFTENVVEVTNNELKWNEEWRSGGNDAVTFTLTLNGETVCENRPRSEWRNYINEYAPAGSYTLEFNVKALTLGTHSAWWSDSLTFTSDEGLEYSSFSRKYSFEVYKAELETVLPDSQSFTITDYTQVFASVAQSVRYAEYISVESVKKSGTYWAEVADRFYSAPEVKYFVAGYSDGFLPADGDFEGCFDQPGEYVVYYAISLPNYSLTQNSGFFRAVIEAEQPPEPPADIVQEQGGKSSGSSNLLIAVCVESAVIAALFAAIIAVAVKKKKS